MTRGKQLIIKKYIETTFQKKYIDIDIFKTKKNQRNLDGWDTIKKTLILLDFWRARRAHIPDSGQLNSAR